MSNPNEDVFPVDENDTDVMVTINLDDGEELDCEIMTIFSLNDQDYIVLLPVDEFGEPYDDNVLIYRYFEDEEGSPSLDNIQSDEEYERVTRYFDAIFNNGSNN